MRLWHEMMLPYIPKQQLLSQHRECCALRGLGWGKKHSIVNYVFEHNYLMLFRYHKKVIKEIQKRGIANIAPEWLDPLYRGKIIGYVNINDLPNIDKNDIENNSYLEHNSFYLLACISNLENKIYKNSDLYSRKDKITFFSFLVDQEVKRSNGKRAQVY